MKAEPEPIEIRKAVAADADALYRLIQQAMRVYALQSGITGSLESLQESADDMLRYVENDMVMVAVRDGQLVGTVRLVRQDRATAWLTRFAVQPHMHQTGVGRMLYQAAEIWLRQAGFRDVSLHTALNNQALVAFYQARGFQLISSDHSRGYPRGLLRKDLADTMDQPGK